MRGSIEVEKSTLALSNGRKLEVKFEMVNETSISCGSESSGRHLILKPVTFISVLGGVRLVEEDAILSSVNDMAVSRPSGLRIVRVFEVVLQDLMRLAFLTMC